MLEKKTAFDLAHLADDHVVVTTYRWIEEDGVAITERTRDMEQIERLQKDLHTYPVEVQVFALYSWGYDLAAYDAARQALIDAQEAMPEPTP